LKSLKPFKSQAKLAPTGHFEAEIVFCLLPAVRCLLSPRREAPWLAQPSA
jgi:hypothetical protein